MMLSAVPISRPVTVNSTLISLTPPVPFHKSTTNKSMREAYQIDNDVAKSTHSLTASLERHPGTDVEMGGLDDSQDHPNHTSWSGAQFTDLPIEIHEAILDHIFGERTSGMGNSYLGQQPDVRSCTRALRHPRRKVLSNLALITPLWRDLVQERIYRHIKIKGTKDGLAECANWFRINPRLVSHVQHIEFWIPVWGDRAYKSVVSHLRELPPIRRYLNEEAGLLGASTVFQGTVPDWDLSENRNRNMSNFTFFEANHNASLEEIFQHVKNVFPETRILTLEAGHRKKPPMIKHFVNDPSGLVGNYHLEQLPNIRTLYMSGAWNIMRDYRHWTTISEALPSLREWHCAYTEPKVEGYLTLCGALLTLSSSVVHLDISLDWFYNKDQSHMPCGRTGHHYMCRLLGQIAPRLEHLSFTGHICANIFNTARAAVLDRPYDARLRSVDLVVKTCCKDKNDQLSPLLDEPPGITNLDFVDAFEELVQSSVRCLDAYPDLSYIRIRFIDLDSPYEILNPYFHMVNNKCTGIWSHEIVEILSQVRPETQYVELSDGIFTQHDANNVIIRAFYPRTRPLSINTGTYRILSEAVKS